MGFKARDRREKTGLDLRFDLVYVSSKSLDRLLLFDILCVVVICPSIIYQSIKIELLELRDLSRSLSREKLCTLNKFPFILTSGAQDP